MRRATTVAPKGIPVTYRICPGVTHGGIDVSAATDATAWLTARFAGHG
jgi:hypothetical protein